MGKPAECKEQCSYVSPIVIDQLKSYEAA